MEDVMLSEATIKKLKETLRGPLIQPKDTSYDEARKLYNGMIDKRPSVIAGCVDAADVIAAVNFGRDNTLPIAIRCGGHNGPGLGSVDDGLVIDLSSMKGVRVDPTVRTARVSAGCTQGDVDHATHAFGLAVPAGIISTTGIAGLTLSGGHGYLSRKYGLTIDNLLEADVVLSDGSMVTASKDENPDLFWGLRGGGGNFGVVTGIDYQLYEVGPEVVGGIVAWPASEAPGVLDLYRNLAEEAPPELTLVTFMRPAPPAPWLPKDMHGKPIIAILACYSGNAEDGEKVVAPIKSFGKPIGDILARRPYAQLQR